MKVKRIFLITLVVLILFTLSLPAAMGSMAMKPAQTVLPVIHTGLYSPSVYVAWPVDCGYWSPFGPDYSPITCPQVSWNS